jgi:hypothetical protein
MNLGELIDQLEAIPDKHRKVRIGFGKPHSWRGSYCELAFEPVHDTTIAAMLQCAQEADGISYTGYKGGEYLMDRSTTVHLAEYGDCTDDDEIGDLLFRLLTGRLPIDREYEQYLRLKRIYEGVSTDDEWLTR